MNKPGIGLAPEGAPIIGLLTVVSLCSAVLDWWPVTVLALILLWFSVHFFRDPERVVPQEDNIAVSPADGRVVRMVASLLVRTICLIKYRRLGFLIHYIIYRDGSSKMVQLHNLHHAY